MRCLAGGSPFCRTAAAAAQSQQLRGPFCQFALILFAVLVRPVLGSIQVSPSALSVESVGRSTGTRTITLSNPTDASVVVDLAVSLTAQRRLGGLTSHREERSQSRRPQGPAVSPPQNRVGARRRNATTERCANSSRILLRLREDRGSSRSPQDGNLRRSADKSTVRGRMEHEAGVRPGGWRSLRGVDMEIVEVDCEAGADPQAVMDSLKEKYGDAIDKIGLDGKVYPATESSTPNDARWADQWNMERVQVASAWDKLIELGIPTSGVRETIVAVIDTGTELTNSDLANMLWTNPGEIPDNGIDDDENGYVDDVYGYNFYNDNSDVDDDSGHGTHCAGVIAAQANNDVGVAGIASQYANVKIMTLKFLGADGGAVSAAVEALNYAVMMGAMISSNSYTASTGHNLFDAALESAASAGHLFISAAGNEGSDFNSGATLEYPCCVSASNNLCIASTDESDALSSFSNHGDDYVHIAAPGSSILSTYHTSLVATQSGTSMATPLVAGAAALVYSAFGYLTALEIKDLLLDSTESLSALEGGVTSHGLLDALQLVESSAGGAPWLALPSNTDPFGQQLEVTVPAGDSVTVDVQIGHECLTSGGSYSGTLDLTWSGGSSTVAVDFQSEGIAEFSLDLDGSQLDFGSCVTGVISSCSQTVVLSNTGDVPGSFQVDNLADPFSLPGMDNVVIEVAARSSTSLSFYCISSGSGSWQRTVTMKTTGNVSTDTGSTDALLEVGTKFDLELSCSMQAGPKLQLDTYSGAAIVDSDNSLLHFSNPVPAQWEGSLSGESLTASLVLPSEDNSKGCATYDADDVATVTDNIVLLLRGDCTFVDKALYAENAGAAGVLIYDSEATTTLEVLALPSGVTTPSIPTFLVSNTEGLFLVDHLAMSEAFTIMLSWKPLIVRTGTDRTGSGSVTVTNSGSEAFDWTASFRVVNSYAADNDDFYELHYPGSRNGEATMTELISSGMTSLKSTFSDSDESAIALNLATNIPFFGRAPGTSIIISTNGIVYFDGNYNSNDWDAIIGSNTFDTQAFFAPFAADYILSSAASDVKGLLVKDDNEDLQMVIIQFAEVNLWQSVSNGGSESVTYEVRLHKNGTFEVLVEDWPSDIANIDMPEVGLEDWANLQGVSIEKLLPLDSDSPFAVAYVPWVSVDWDGIDTTIGVGASAELDLDLFGRNSRSGYATITATSDAVDWQVTRRVRIVHEALSYSWNASEWSDCGCSGSRTRVLACMGSDGVEYDSSYCEAEQCRDLPFGWRDNDGYSCLEHEAYEWCTSTGETGSGWSDGWGSFDAYSNYGYSADQACCACGGGQQPDDKPEETEACTPQDSDNDDTCDAEDECPNDPGKIAPGTCGCGIAEGCTESSSTSTLSGTTSSTSITTSTTSASSSSSRTSSSKTTSTLQSSTKSTTSLSTESTTSSTSLSTDTTRSWSGAQTGSSTGLSTSSGLRISSSTITTTGWEASTTALLMDLPDTTTMTAMETTSSSQRSSSARSSISTASSSTRSSSGSSSSTGSSTGSSSGSTTTTTTTTKISTPTSRSSTSTSIATAPTTKYTTSSSSPRTASSGSSKSTTSSSLSTSHSSSSSSSSQTTTATSGSTSSTSHSSLSTSSSDSSISSTGSSRSTSTSSLSTASTSSSSSTATSSSIGSSTRGRTTSGPTSSTASTTSSRSVSGSSSTSSSLRSSSTSTWSSSTTTSQQTPASDGDTISSVTTTPSTGSTASVTLATGDSTATTPASSTSTSTASSQLPTTPSTSQTSTTTATTPSSTSTTDTTATSTSSSETSSSTSTPSSTSTTTTAPPVLRVQGQLEAVVENCASVAQSTSFRSALGRGIASTASVPESSVVIGAVNCLDARRLHHGVFQETGEHPARHLQETAEAIFTIAETEGVDLEVAASELMDANASTITNNLAEAFATEGMEQMIQSVGQVSAVVVEVTTVTSTSSSKSSQTTSSSTGSTTTRSSHSTSSTSASTETSSTTLSTSTSLTSSSTTPSSATSTSSLRQVAAPAGEDSADVPMWVIPVAVVGGVLGALCLCGLYCAALQGRQPVWVGTPPSRSKLRPVADTYLASSSPTAAWDSGMPPVRSSNSPPETDNNNLNDSNGKVDPLSPWLKHDPAISSVDSTSML